MARASTKGSQGVRRAQAGPSSIANTGAGTRSIANTGAGTRSIANTGAGTRDQDARHACPGGTAGMHGTRLSVGKGMARARHRPGTCRALSRTGTSKGWTDTRLALGYPGLVGQGPGTCQAMLGHVPGTTGGSAIAILLLPGQGIRPKATPGVPRYRAALQTWGTARTSARHGPDTRQAFLPIHLRGIQPMATPGVPKDRAALQTRGAGRATRMHGTRVLGALPEKGESGSRASTSAKVKAHAALSPFPA